MLKKIQRCFALQVLVKLIRVLIPIMLGVRVLQYST